MGIGTGSYVPAGLPKQKGPAALATRDSSYSNIRLTKRNFNGPHLLRIIKGSDNSSSLPSNTLPENERPATKVMSEEDVNAPPRDSSGEEEEADKTSNASINTKTTDKLEDQSPRAPPKRSSGRLREHRPSKRQKLEDQPDLLKDTPQEKAKRNTLARSSPQSTEWEMFDSQEAAPRRSQTKSKTYARRTDIGLKYNATEFKAPKDIPDKPTGNERTGPAKAVTPVPPVEAPLRPRNVFKAFNLPSHDLLPPDSSEASQPAVLSNSFHSSGQPEQSGSSPPSTPVSEHADCELSDTPATGIKTNICPLCQKEVVRSRLKDPCMNIQEVGFFPLRKQQAFCHEHTQADARVLFAEQEFPEIDWIRLKTVRIPKHKKFLKDIMHQKVPSHFIREVEVEIPDKPNRKQIREYLEKHNKKGATLAPTGYYGAKGAQIMAEVIAQELSPFMSGRVAHELIKCIGVGPFIANVLVPELTQRLVMEDMNLGDAAKARTIMHESAYAGMILCPEDEKVERQDDD